MIDRTLFPDEYMAIERLKMASRYYEQERKKKREEKQKRIAECRERRKKHSE